jgi:hypothetical protein
LHEWTLGTISSRRVLRYTTIMMTMRVSIRRVASAMRRFSNNAAPPQSLYEKYNKLLLEKPVATKSITAGVIAFVADIMCQKLVKTEGKENDGIDWRRTFNFTLMQFALIGPSLHFWYGFLMTRFPGAALVNTLQRVVLDQFLFAPFFVIPVMFSAGALLNGKPETVVQKLEQDWKPTLLANWAVWIPAQFINFRFVPAQFQVLFANLIGLGWNVYLSGTMAKELPAGDASSAEAVPVEKPSAGK